MADEADATRRHQTADGFTALPTGTILHDRFEIDGVLGSGGFGITYLARDRVLGRELAIKEHFPRQFAYRDGGSLGIRTTDPKTFEWARDRFVQEARTLARCDHPNVVRVIDYFEGHGTAYMALEYVSGQSLKSWLQMLGRPPSQAELDDLLAPLLDALEHVHGKGVLHRDIKPDNIIVRPDGKPCLIDFGAARLAIAGHTQTLTGIISPDFSPPEQHDPSGRGQREASDIYALGATIYRALTGQSPPSAMLRASHDDLLPVASTIGLAATPERPGLNERTSQGDGGRPARAAQAGDLGHAAAYRPSFLAGIDQALRVRISERPQSVSAWRQTLLDGRAPDQPAENGEPGPVKQRRGPIPTPLPTPPPVPPPNWLPWALGATGGLVIVAVIAAQMRPPRVAETPQRTVVSSTTELPQQRLSKDGVALSQLPAAQRADPARAIQPGRGQAFRDALVGGADCPFCPEMVVLPAGNFLMGSPKSEPERDGDEGVNDTAADARLRVTIASPFAMGKFEVTRGQMATFVAETGYTIAAGCVVWTGTEWKRQPENSWTKPGITQDESHPVVCVNWPDAKAYVAWLSTRTGRPYRLPSEAEWEFAVRGVTTATPNQPTYFFGTDVARLANYAWYHGSDGRGTHSVGQKSATNWQLHDILGNAREWLDDCWHANYQNHPATEQSWTTSCHGDAMHKVVRGGGWPHAAKLLRSAHRGAIPQAERHNELGFRVARAVAAN